MPRYVTPKDLSGQRFGRLLVIRLDQPRNGKNSPEVWWCRCDCGIELGVRRDVMVAGHKRSCGCLAREYVEGLRRHGMTGTPEHRTWKKIKERCLNPSCKEYPRYGGRGIGIHPAWVESFESFYAEVGPKPSPQHSLDRIDNDRGYEPGNVRWATAAEQARNTSRNVWLTLGDRRMTVADWAKELGVDRGLLAARIRIGWDDERVLLTPLRGTAPPEPESPEDDGNHDTIPSGEPEPVAMDTDVSSGRWSAARLASKDLSGRRFGMLVVVRLDQPWRPGSQSMWLCRCDCGSRTVVARGSLTGGNTKSCGCLRTRLKAERMFRHGMTGTSEHQIWLKMLDRCRNPQCKEYPRYGARGIKVHPAWMESFELFYEDVGPRPSKGHSLDRIDNDGDYEPDNVQWATRAQQARNKRNNVWLTLDGRTMVIADWAVELGCNRDTLYARRRLGWSDEKILLTPIGP